MTAISQGEAPSLAGQTWPERMANSVLRRHSPSSVRWHCEQGLILRALEQVWLKTGDGRYRRYIQDSVDHLVDTAGRIRGYTLEEYNLDQINPGRALLFLYCLTGEPRYEMAIRLLREQLRTHPRTGEGGFWQKKIYPHQMWLEGIYMASPFYAEFGRTFAEPAILDDVAHQITLIERHTRDPRTGLLYHGWDESRRQRWADPETGCSPHFWGPAVGWYAMALVDVLDHLPAGHPRHGEVAAVLARLAGAVARAQDASTGLWYQVLDQGGRPGNYHEASASCMFVYALTKGVRQGHLAGEYLAVAQKGWAGITAHLVRADAQGLVNLAQVCAVARLGGDPYHDGSYEYYTGERVAANDPKGVGAFILAGVEMERMPTCR